VASKQQRRAAGLPQLGRGQQIAAVWHQRQMSSDRGQQRAANVLL